MKFRNKIIFTYSIFLILVAGLFIGFYYQTSVRQYTEREHDNIRTISNVKLQQMEDLVWGMESAMMFILSDPEILVALRDFSTLEVEAFEELFFSPAGTTIRVKIGSYYLAENFYRMIVFNHSGNVIANNIARGDRIMNPEASVENYPWLDRVSGRGGENVLIGLHEDSWGAENRPLVISLVKEVQGYNMGFIEIQYSQESLDQIFMDPESDLTLLFLTREGELLYSNQEGINASYYASLLNGENGETLELTTYDGERALGFVTGSQQYGFTLLTMTRVDIEGEVMRAVLPMSLLFLFGGVSVAILYIFVTSRRLTKPIDQLKSFMENTQLEDMGKVEIPEKLSNDEIEVLYTTYKDVLKRLSISMTKEERLSIMQLQAQFDLLQAQVNPHFIYNVLNVISNRGVRSGDDVICEICSELAGMLRYSTNTKAKYATVGQEVEYLEMYLGLLKHRYDYKLNYQVTVDDTLRKEILPRIVLQQMVENSIDHGYNSDSESITIEVIGERFESGWRLVVRDNGDGITKEKVAQIEASMKEVKEKLSSNRDHVELEIGGMGLINIFARLYILYNEDLNFEISPVNGRGTQVLIEIITEKSDALKE